MAKITGLFNFHGTHKGVTVVRSKTYGEHIRAARGTHKPAKLNDAMERQAQMTSAANQLAKVVKDAFDAYRKGAGDGMMWPRLVSLVKRQLKANGVFDFNTLTGFDFSEKHKLEALIDVWVDAVDSDESESVLKITTTSRCHLTLTRDRADSYEQALIVVFLDAEMVATTTSESIVLPLLPVEQREHKTQFPIPDDAKTAVIAVRCSFIEEGKPVEKIGRRCMRIVKVMEWI